MYARCTQGIKSETEARESRKLMSFDVTGSV
jgi:hypothetical protein